MTIEVASIAHITNKGRATRLGLASSFCFASINAWLWGVFPPSFVTFVSFFLIFVGAQFLSSKQKPDMREEEIPMYSLPVIQSESFGSRLASISIKQIIEDRESKRIFTFLVINLIFMFVEMMYGFITNSLGLISDACHMLFDCTALLIGLYAAVISKWEANPLYSYGFGRAQVVSGFTNSVFLVFVSIMVFMESLERFSEPPEIKTDRLLLVSVLGFLVNMVGVFCLSRSWREEEKEEEEVHLKRKYRRCLSPHLGRHSGERGCHYFQFFGVNVWLEYR